MKLRFAADDAGQAHSLSAAKLRLPCHGLLFAIEPDHHHLIPRANEITQDLVRHVIRVDGQGKDIPRLVLLHGNLAAFKL